MKEMKNQRRDGKDLKERNISQIQNSKSAVEIGGENVRGTSLLLRAGKGNGREDLFGRKKLKKKKIYSK